MDSGVVEVEEEDTDEAAAVSAVVAEEVMSSFFCASEYVLPFCVIGRKCKFSVVKASSSSPIFSYESYVFTCPGPETLHEDKCFLGYP